MVEQAARVPSSVFGPANCFATRYCRSRIRIQSPKMQIGLRFAAAKLPGLRTGRVVGNLVELSRHAQRPEAPVEDSGVCYRHTRQIRCTIKKGSAVEP